MSTFTNSEDPDEMPHIGTNLQTKNTIFFENYNLTPLNMYNGLSQVYCNKPEGRIHKTSIQMVNT